MGKTILITGTSSGFGKLTAELLLKKGYTVIACMRDIDQKNLEVAEELKGIGATVIELDIADNESVESAMNSIRNIDIDILINNAGVGAVGWMENFTTADLDRVFQVNVFGSHRMIRSVLPAMKKRGKGQIIQLSSLLGKFSMPFLGPYSASKHAIESIIETYQSELTQFGISFHIVEPGTYPTNFGKNLIKSSDIKRFKSYSNATYNIETQMQAFEVRNTSNNAPNPYDIAAAIVNLLENPKPPFVSVVDSDTIGEDVSVLNSFREKITQNIFKKLGIIF